MKPVIAIVGRPNVGKSTLFNRLAKKRKAIVEDQPGVTRDRNYAEVDWNEHSFIIIDTGGFEPAAKEHLQQQVREQAVTAIREADVILFMLDGQEGLNPIDREIADYLRKTAKPTFTVVNKIDGERQEEKVLDFHALGVTTIFSISAEHGRGVGDLMDEVIKALPHYPPGQEKPHAEIRVALVGRPNVGKSSLLNRLIGRPRAVIDSTPGTTRDAIDTFYSREGKNFLFIDTAGLRRKSKVTERLERFSTIRSLKSMERCDVVLVLIDGFEGLTEQDARIVEFAAESGRAIILLVNKWDLVEKDSSTTERYQDRIRREMKTLDYVPILFISALTGQRVTKIFSAVEEVVAQHRKRISTAKLNQWLQEAIQTNPPPLAHKRRVKFYYISQIAVGPPTFILFTNQPQGVGASYQRYLLRRLREEFGYQGTPLRLFLRQREKTVHRPQSTVHRQKQKD